MMHRSSPSVFSFSRFFLQWRLLFFVYVIILGFLVYSFGKEFLHHRAIQADIAHLQEREKALTSHNLELSQLQTVFQTEGFLEREARLKLELRKPGEQVVIIDSPQLVVPSSSYSSSDSVPSVNPDMSSFFKKEWYQNGEINIKRWWRYFF